ncbi:MAG: VOC family protein, partial [Pseudomonadota bacterium]
MSKAMLEHVNLTVTDPDKTAEMLCDLFDWRIRWAG